MNPRTFFCIGFVFLLGCVMLQGLSGEVNRVAVRAEASIEFRQNRAKDDKRIQSYHLVEGKFFGGDIADSSLDEVTFEEIADQLALNLKRQNFVPAETNDVGDLLILVNYGASRFLGDRDRYGFIFSDILPPVVKPSGEVYDYPLTKQAIPKFWGTILPSERMGVKEQYFRSMVLGFEGVYSSKVTSYEAYIQRQLAGEGRYFIYVSAFDLPLLRKGEKKILWTTRYSIRSIGQSFEEAIKQLNTVAGHYFGKHFDHIINKRSTDPSLVEVGEIEVIDEGKRNSDD